MIRSKARPLLAALTLLAAATLPACTDRALDPEYPTAVVTFDDALAGTWVALNDDGKPREGDAAVTITIAAAKVPIKDDRLDPNTELDKAEATTDAYTATVTPGDPELPGPWNLNAYRLTIGERHYLGAQLSFKQYEQTKLFTLVVPVHYIVRVERDGDTLRLWSNEPAITWIPAAAPLDPLPEGAAPPPLPRPADEDENDAIAVTSTNIDRLIALLSRPDADTLFAGEPMVLKRAAPKPTPSP